MSSDELRARVEDIVGEYGSERENAGASWSGASKPPPLAPVVEQLLGLISDAVQQERRLLDETAQEQINAMQRDIDRLSAVLQGIGGLHGCYDCSGGGEARKVLREVHGPVPSPVPSPQEGP